MGTWFWLVLAIALPTAVGYAVLGMRLAGRWLGERGASDPAESLDTVGAHLRRLRADLDRGSDAPRLPARHTRLQATRAAYIDALSRACALLNLTPPRPPDGGLPTLAEIRRVELDLRAHGLDVDGAHAD